MGRTSREPSNKITGANAGGPRQLAMRTRWPPASLSSIVDHATDALIYIAAALWILGYGVIVYLYFAPWRCGLHINRRTTFRQAFFELAAAFFFVPVALFTALQHWLRARRTPPDGV
jgi:hypothetical protein